MSCMMCKHVSHLINNIDSIQIWHDTNEALIRIFYRYTVNIQIDKEDLKKINREILWSDIRYERMTKDQQQYLSEQLKNLDKDFFVKTNYQNQIGMTMDNNKAHYICRYCKKKIPIKQGRIIYTNKNICSYRNGYLYDDV